MLVTIQGTNANDDVRIFNNQAQEFDMLGGDDVVYAGGGDDVLLMGAGNDRAFAGRGDDLLDMGQGDDFGHGNSGDDVLLGRSGDDVLNGGAGNDRLFGGSDDDVLFGSAGNDLLNGGSGDDILNGGEGRNIMVGGDGADAFNFFPQNTSNNFINDFDTDEDVINVIEFGTDFASLSSLITYNPSGTRAVIQLTSDVRITLNNLDGPLTEDDFIFEAPSDELVLVGDVDDGLF